MTEYQRKRRERDPEAAAREKAYHAARYQARRNAARAALHEALGGACECCGEDNPSFLTLDHIHGVPPEHQAKDPARRKARNGGGRISTLRVYELVLAEGAPREKYRLLCWNCHMAEAHFGVCPHRVAEEVMSHQ